jgi:hypothetical protein
MQANSGITRRTALLGAAVGSGMIAAPAVVRAQAKVRLTLGHGRRPATRAPSPPTAWRRGCASAATAASRCGSRARRSSATTLSMLTGMRTGTLDMSVNSQGPISSVVPELAAFGLPFLFRQSARRLPRHRRRHGAGDRAQLEAVGLISLGWWDNGIRHITNSKRPINRPEDLRGLKIRTPPDPTTIDIFQALGAATQQVNFNELYVGLQQGVVDGQENPLANIHSAKLYEVNKFISLSSHQWQCNPSSPRGSPGAACGRRTSASCRRRRRRPRPTSGPFRRRPTRGCSASTAPTRRSR